MVVAGAAAGAGGKVAADGVDAGAVCAGFEEGCFDGGGKGEEG